MNCTKFAEKLTKARNYQEAQPILETMNLSPSAHQLLQWAYNLPSNQAYFLENVKQTVIQEAKMREEEERKGTHEEEEKHMTKEEEEEEKKLKEYEGGEGQISSKPGMEHLDREDKSTTSGQEPDTGFNNPENQMRESLRKFGISEAVINKVLKEMDKTTPTQKQMIESIITEVRRVTEPIHATLKQHREALIALNKKVTEASSKSTSIPLQIPTPTPPGNRMQEASSVPINGLFEVRRSQSLEDTRREITELNNAMNNGLLRKPDASAYQ